MLARKTDHRRAATRVGGLLLVGLTLGEADRTLLLARACGVGGNGRSCGCGTRDGGSRGDGSGSERLFALRDVLDVVPALDLLVNMRRRRLDELRRRNSGGNRGDDELGLDWFGLGGYGLGLGGLGLDRDGLRLSARQLSARARRATGSSRRLVRRLDRCRLGGYGLGARWARARRLPARTPARRSCGRDHSGRDGLRNRRWGGSLYRRRLLDEVELLLDRDSGRALRTIGQADLLLRLARTLAGNFVEQAHSLPSDGSFIGRNPGWTFGSRT